ncbi:hypothetical protein F9883_17375, partial [Morganella morganii]|uniref:hypothetical protein n=1 Tax=Morganella morganii TaxID=582 RepID=UPI0015F6642A
MTDEISFFGNSNNFPKFVLANSMIFDGNLKIPSSKTDFIFSVTDEISFFGNSNSLSKLLLTNSMIFDGNFKILPSRTGLSLSEMNFSIFLGSSRILLKSLLKNSSIFAGSLKMPPSRIPFNFSLMLPIKSLTGLIILTAFDSRAFKLERNEPSRPDNKFLIPLMISEREVVISSQNQ